MNIRTHSESEGVKRPLTILFPSWFHSRTGEEKEVALSQVG